MLKTCPVCGDQFQTTNAAKKCCSPECSSVNKYKKCREYRETHRETIRKKNRKYRENHREELCEYQRKYRLLHPEYLREYRRRRKELAKDVANA